jgi:hypothetical protein
MKVTASELRRNVYQLLDKVLTTGVPLEIEHGGQRLLVVPAEASTKLSRQTPHPGTILADPAARSSGCIHTHIALSDVGR